MQEPTLLISKCNPSLFEFAPVFSHAVVAPSYGGTITPDEGGLLLGATDRAIGLVKRFAGCFTDHRCAALIEHEVDTLVGQRVFSIALGYEDLNDHAHGAAAGYGGKSNSRSANLMLGIDQFR